MLYFTVIKNNSILVSAIVPVYNTETYLPKCIDSILRQTYSRLEVILVDDGSTDRCGEICDEYAQKDNRVRVVHQRNSGSVAARTFGLSVAKGEYVAWVDSDDWIATETYEQLVEAAVSGDCDVVWCDVMIVLNDRVCPSIVKYTEQPDEMIRRILGGEIPGWLCNKLIKKSFYDSVDMRHYIGDDIMEDLLYSVELLCAHPRMGYVPRPLYYYNRANESAMTAGKGIVIRGLNNIRHTYDYLIEKNLFSIYKADFAYLAMQAKLALLLSGRTVEAVSLFGYAHKYIAAYRMSPPASWIYWLGFNGGMMGRWLIASYLKIYKRGK